MALDSSEHATPMHVVEVTDGACIKLGHSYVVRPFTTLHRVTSQGYAVFAVSNKVSACMPRAHAT